MEDYPHDIFSLLGQNLSLEDIISLSMTNSKIKAILMSPGVNTQLATSLNFPYNLTFDELVKYNGMSLEDRLVNAASTGDMRIAKVLINNANIYDYNRASASAVLNKNDDILNLLLDHGANNYGGIAMTAAEIGNKDLVIEMLSKHGNEITYLKRAIGRTLGYNGHYIPEFLGNDDYYDGYIYGATDGNHIELVKKLVELREDLSVFYIAGLLDNAIILEEIEIADYLLELVEYKINNRLFDERDSYYIVQSLNHCMANAAQKGYLDIVIRVIKLGANDYRRAFRAAKEGGHIEVAKKISRLEEGCRFMYEW